MAETTPIEWTDRTWSPWEGCTKVSPGCDNCYAAAMNNWLRHGENWGPGAPRRIYSEDHWEKPVKWQRDALKFETLHHRRQRLFPSVCDPFDKDALPFLRARLWGLIRLTPAIDWLLLTKRIGNAAGMLPADWGDGYKNVWLGATVVNQEEADRDIPKLLAAPARVRFLSIEPMLGPVDLNQWLLAEHGRRLIGAQPGIHWVICGGESGRQARPMHSQWPRLLRDQCDAAGVPFLFKQWGEWHESIESDRSCWVAADGRGTIQHGTDEEAQAFLGNTGTQWRLAYRPGKKAAGRLLDGVQHDGFPGVQ